MVETSRVRAVRILCAEAEQVVAHGRASLNKRKENAAKKMLCIYLALPQWVGPRPRNRSIKGGQTPADFLAGVLSVLGQTTTLQQPLLQPQLPYRQQQIHCIIIALFSACEGSGDRWERACGCGVVPTK